MRDRISPTALAEITKVPQPTIFRILNGDSADPRTSTVRPLAEYFGVSVSDIRDRDLTQGERPPAPVAVESKSGGGLAGLLDYKIKGEAELRLIAVYRLACKSNSIARAAIEDGVEAAESILDASGLRLDKL